MARRLGQATGFRWTEAHSNETDDSGQEEEHGPGTMAARTLQKDERPAGIDAEVRERLPGRPVV